MKNSWRGPHPPHPRIPKWLVPPASTLEFHGDATETCLLLHIWRLIHHFLVVEVGVTLPESNTSWGTDPLKIGPTCLPPKLELCSSSNRCLIFNGRLAVSFSEGDGWMLTWTRQGWIWSHMIFLPLPGLILLECIFLSLWEKYGTWKGRWYPTMILNLSICSFHLRYSRECNTSAPFVFHHLQDHQSPIKRPPTSNSEASRKKPLPGDASNHVFIRPDAVWGVGPWKYHGTKKP